MKHTDKLYLIKSAVKVNTKAIPFEIIRDAFRKSYLDATGHAFDDSKLASRLANWEIFGRESPFGGVAVRPQRNNLNKLTAMFGDKKSILTGIKDLQTEFKAKPLWGAVTKDIEDTSRRFGMFNIDDLIAQKMGFAGKFLPKQMIKQKLLEHVIPKIPQRTFGDAVFQGISPNGGIKFNSPDIGTVEKHLIGNQSYIDELTKNFSLQDVVRQIMK